MNERAYRIRTTPQELAQSLLMELFVPVTAVALLDSEGMMTGIRLFDTAFGGKEIHPAQDCAQAWVIFGHPDGSLELSAEEESCLQRLREGMNAEYLHVFLAGEDIGVLSLEDWKTP